MVLDVLANERRDEEVRVVEALAHAQLERHAGVLARRAQRVRLQAIQKFVGCALIDEDRGGAGAGGAAAPDAAAWSPDAAAATRAERQRLASLYLHDWGLPAAAPDLLDAMDAHVPRYFARDLLQRCPRGALYREGWPSLFVGPPRSRSGLHVDTFGSHFWMALHAGRKRWVFFDADDAPLLYPTWRPGDRDGGLEPSFAVDPVASPDMRRYPAFRLARPRVCELRAGEVLFVPAGSPHFVENVGDEPTVALSGNYVDATNADRALRELDVAGRLDDRAAELAGHLRRVMADGAASDADDAVGPDAERDLPWREYKAAHAARRRGADDDADAGGGGMGGRRAAKRPRVDVTADAAE
mmetsp:Transcript_908/g.2869  ORF Transcript_908/g.2869 Transcript_908/m.2869 type:complete len:356 (+) Transcript_908:1514-2581(+)